MGCEHLNFAAEVDVHRLTKQDDPATVTGFMTDVRIRCAECGRRFQFLGLDAGVDLGGAKVSIDGLEAHLALCPQGEQPSVLDRIAVHFPPTVRQ